MISKPSVNSTEQATPRYRIDDEAPPSIAVINAVAETQGCDPLELTPIFEVVDPDALDALGKHHRRGGEPIEISFEYEGYLVHVQYSRRSWVVLQEASAGE